MLHIGICDDDRIFLAKAENCLKDYQQEKELEICIHTFQDSEELNAYIEKKEPPLNILFLDIVLKDQNGIGIGKKINFAFPRCQIIFVTSHSEYAMDVYETVHSGYIVKSEFDQRFHRSLDLLFEQRRLITLPSKGQNITWPLSDICYIERGRRISKIVTFDSCREDGQTVNCSFSDLCCRLAGRQFVRCHNSFLINLCEVRVYSSEGFTMNNGDYIPISRKYRTSVREQFIDWQRSWL